MDTLLDAAFITMDVVDVACNGLNWENSLYLGADLLGLAIPFATGLGLGARAAFHGSEGIHVLEAVHNIAETTGKHLLSGNRAQKALREGKEVHVFHEGLDLSELERLVWTEGTFQGTVGEFERFVYRSDTPIGSRILNGQKTHDLYYVEIKGRLKGDGRWHYHMDPRPRPKGVE